MASIIQLDQSQGGCYQTCRYIVTLRALGITCVLNTEILGDYLWNPADLVTEDGKPPPMRIDLEEE